MTLDHADFLDKGYAIVPGLYGQDQTAGFINSVHSVFADAMNTAGQPFERDGTGRVSNESLIALFQADPQLHIACMGGVQNLVQAYEMATTPALSDAIKALGMSRPGFSTKPIFMMNNPHTSKSTAYWKMPAHQDWRSIQGSLNGLIVWVALEDITESVGPLEVIAGSHTWGLLASEKDEWYRSITDTRVHDAAFRPVSVKAGDAIIFSAFLVHRSGINDGTDFRYSMQFRYNDLAEPSFLQRRLPTTYGSDVPTHDYVDEDDLVTGAAVLSAFKPRPASDAAGDPA